MKGTPSSVALEIRAHCSMRLYSMSFMRVFPPLSPFYHPLFHSSLSVIPTIISLFKLVRHSSPVSNICLITYEAVQDKAGVEKLAKI